MLVTWSLPQQVNLYKSHTTEESLSTQQVTGSRASLYPADSLSISVLLIVNNIFLSLASPADESRLHQIAWRGCSVNFHCIPCTTKVSSISLKEICSKIQISERDFEFFLA